MKTLFYTKISIYSVFQTFNVSKDRLVYIPNVLSTWDKLDEIIYDDINMQYNNVHLTTDSKTPYQTLLFKDPILSVLRKAFLNTLAQTVSHQITFPLYVIPDLIHITTQ